MVMPVLAAASLQYAVRRRVGLIPVLGFLLSYKYLLARGFLTYLFSAGLAVMLFAGWLACADWPRWRRAPVFAAAGLLLYFCHVFAFLAYGILVSGHELARAVRARGQKLVAVGGILVPRRHRRCRCWAWCSGCAPMQFRRRERNALRVAGGEAEGALVSPL
ncbi:MAG: hypothetical protein WDN04_11825 [Rhodospirillales bacterium]